MRRLLVWLASLGGLLMTAAWMFCIVFAMIVLTQHTLILRLA